MARKKQQYGLGSIYQKKVKGEDGVERTLPNWYIQFYQDGRVHRESSGTPVYKKASDYLKQRQAEMASGVLDTHAEKTTVAELLDDLLADYKETNPRSVNCFANGIVVRLRKHLGAYRADKIQTKELQGFVAALRKESLAVATINRHLAILRRAYKLGTLHQPRKVLPTAVPNFGHFMQREDNARKGFFEHADYLKMRDALEGAERAALTFAYYSGCRMSEVIGLKWDQVDMTERLVSLHAGETKNHTGRVLPLGTESGELYQMMLAQLQGATANRSAFVFYRRNGSPITTMRHGWARACAATGMNHLFHDLRRTAVRNMVRAGVPDSVAMAISGHKTRAVFERYNIVDESDLHRAAASVTKHLGVPGKACAACAAPITEAAKFCPQCGAKVEG